MLTCIADDEVIRMVGIHPHEGRRSRIAQEELRLANTNMQTMHAFTECMHARVEA